MHLIKLCVGARSTDDLVEWMAPRPAPVHVTRMMPKRRDELLAGGSLYWVIAGWIAARQRLIDIAPMIGTDGITRCRLALDPKIVLTELRPRRPFQGWRYFRPEDAPPDLGASLANLPPKLMAELAALGLL